MMAKPMKTLHLHYPIIQFLIILIIPIPGVYLNDQLKTATNRQQDYLWQEPWEPHGNPKRNANTLECEN